MFRVLAIAPSLLLPNFSAAHAELQVDRPASCLLVVKGFQAIRGECKFTPIDADGSFTIASYNGKFFAYIIVVQRGVAEGAWNEEPYATHAHTSLGILEREGGCWVNDMTSVCAY